jgi:PAS domain S-box-containing protein
LKDEPDIIKQLKEEERRGILHCKPSTCNEEYDIKEGQTKKISYTISDIIKDHIKYKKEDFYDGKPTKADNKEKVINQLKESKEQYRFLVEHAPFFISSLDDSGKFTLWNHYSEKMLGYTSEEMIGKKSPRDIHVSDEDAEEVIRIAIKKGKYDNEIDLIHKNGKKVHSHLIVVPYKDEHNKIITFIGLAEDITERKLAENQLKQSELTYKTIINTTKEGFWYLDSEGRFLDVNTAACDLLGYNKEELLKMKVSDIEGLENQKDVTQHIQKMKKYGGDRFETTHKRKDGEFFDAEVITSFVTTTEGFERIFVFSHDITDRKKTEVALRESEENLRNLIEFSPDGIITVNTIGVITGWNQEAVRLSGYSKDEMIGKHFTKTNLFRYKYVPKYLKLFHSSLNGKEVKPFEIEYFRKDGTRLIADVRVRLQKSDGKIIGALITTRDITERKKADEELIKAHEKLQKLNEQLEQKVMQRTREIENLLKQKNDFVNQLGHDLKNPMTPLTTLLPIIRKRTTDQKSLELLDVVTKNTNYIKNLMVKTIELAQLNAPNAQFDIKDTNLVKELEKVLETKHLWFKDNNISIHNKIKSTIIVQADELRLEELFENLLSNAIKYSHSGGIITFDAKQNADRVTVSIMDTGIGLTKEQMSHVFDEFYKVDESRHDLESTGLGLPICKRIVENHNGKIWVKSKGPGKGSTFYFTLKTRKKGGKNDR